MTIHERDIDDFYAPSQSEISDVRELIGVVGEAALPFILAKLHRAAHGAVDVLSEEVTANISMLIQSGEEERKNAPAPPVQMSEHEQGVAMGIAVAMRFLDVAVEECFPWDADYDAMAEEMIATVEASKATIQ